MASVSRHEAYRASIQGVHFEIWVVVVESAILQPEGELPGELVVYAAAIQERGLSLRLRVYIDLLTIRDIVGLQIREKHPCAAGIKTECSSPDQKKRLEFSLS